MRIAILSDIHGNLPALEAVLRDIEQNRIDDKFCLGDIIGYGANPEECVQIIREISKKSVCGNHEHALMSYVLTGEFPETMNPIACDGVAYAKDKLSKISMDFILSLPLSDEVKKLNLKLSHSSIKSPDRWEYVTNTVFAHMELYGVPQNISLIGHTHKPQIWRNKGIRQAAKSTDSGITLLSDNKYLINVGSVGQPRDGDPRACYLIIDYLENKTKVYFRRVEYDIERAARAIREAQVLDRFLADRLFQGR